LASAAVVLTGACDNPVFAFLPPFTMEGHRRDHTQGGTGRRPTRRRGL